MNKFPIFNSLSARLTIAFLLAAVSGVALVAALAYHSTSNDFNSFVQHMQGMGGMMGGQVYNQSQSGFLSSFRQTLWIAGLSGVALALLLGAFFTWQIVAPLDKVTAAARRVARGDLNQRVKVSGSGELAELGQSFNLMAATLGRDQTLRRNMVADIAHELRTPLSILQGNVEAMLDGVLEANTENLTSLHQETLHLARLVEDLRTLSLAEAGQLQFQPGDTDLKALSTQVIEGFQTQLASKNVSAALEAPNASFQAWADPDRTAQVLRNLVSNAMHYTSEGGHITVQLASDSDGVTVSVIDTGVGIPSEDLPQIFDRFYRVDRSRARNTGGSGLGLTIVKQLVGAQGGRVWAKSEPGKGSTFSFWLPRSS